MRVVVTGDSALEVEGQRALIQGMGLDCSAKDCIAHTQLGERLAQAPAADLIVVVSGKDPEAALRTVRHAVAVAGAPVLAVASSKEKWPMFKEAGAQQVLEPENVKEGLSQAASQGVASRPRAGGKVIGVLSAQTGAGVTTVATNLAFALGAGQLQKTALVEAGPGVPEIALHLDLKVQHSFADLVRNWERMDAYMVRQLAAPHASGLNVLAYAAATSAALSVERDTLQRLVALARGLYEVTVLDLGHGPGALARAGVALADHTVVLFRPEVPSLRLTQSLLKQFRDADLPMERIRLAANRTGWRQQVDAKEVEKTLSLPVVDWLPDEPATVIAAQNQGQPLSQYSSRAKITRSIERLAQALLPKK